MLKKKLELFLLVWCRLNLGRQTCTIFQGATAFFTVWRKGSLTWFVWLTRFAASTLCTGNLILMISGVNALSLGLLGNVVYDRFRLAWFVTQALWAHYVKCWFSFVFGVKVLQIYSLQSLRQQVSFLFGLSTFLLIYLFFVLIKFLICRCSI